MEQIPFLYFMLVMITVLGGFFIAHQVITAKLPALEGLYKFLNHSTTSRLILAFSAMLVGFVSLIVGKVYMNFFPALLAMVVAGIIFLEEYLQNNGTQNKFTGFLSKYGVGYKNYWGIAAVGFGLLHIFTVNVAWI